MIGYYVYSRDSSALVNLTLKRYARDPAFTQFIGVENVFDRSASRNNDTGLYYMGGRSTQLDPNYNYIFEVGAKRYKLRDIYFDSRTENPGGWTSEVDACYNLTHYTINDSSYTIDQRGRTSADPYVYIHVGN